MTRQPSYVLWLTGPSGAGKSTIADRLVEEYRKRKITVEQLDGDIVRNFFEKDLGYTRQERILNVKRIAFAAMLLARHGIHVVVANIAPYFEVRDFVRRHLPLYLQVYVKASPQVLRERDVKGHYGKVARGELSNMIGVDDVYDEPRRPDLIVNTAEETVEQSVERVVGLCRSKGIFNS